jgi:hypothetical protein
VRIAVGVTSRATERALARDLNGKQRHSAGQNSAPSG